MTPYYPTIDQDMTRARAILASGKADPPADGGTIVVADLYAAYKLLESFLEHIVYLHQQQEAFYNDREQLEHTIEELERFKKHAIKVNQEAARTLAASARETIKLAQLADKIPPPPRKMGPLDRRPSEAWGGPCPGCKQPLAFGDYVTLIQIGPGDNVAARERARSGQPYTGVAILAHWSCVTGEETEVAPVT